MNVFGIGLPELAVIAAIGLVVFGPKRLPELGRALGRTLRGFQSASSEFEREFRSAIADEGEPIDSRREALAAAATAAAAATDPAVGDAAVSDAAAAGPAATADLPAGERQG